MRILQFLLIMAVIDSATVWADEIVRIDSIELRKPQPHPTNPKVIWYDAFDAPSHQYFEQKGNLTWQQALGGTGSSLEVFYPKGQGGGGSAGRKLAIGDTPVGSNKAVKRGRKFDNIYWRMYVKHPKGWTGDGPAKMSRATIFNASNWSQAMISHVWGSGQNLTLDPVRAASGNHATTSHYNDWDGLKWLGNTPGSQIKIHASEEAGRWICVEAQAKLNTPGESDGYNCLWIDGIQQCERTDLDFRSSYTKYGINAILIESYWNKGSPVDQYRWYDDFVVATEYIGPIHAPLNPVLTRTTGPSKWEVMIAVHSQAGSVTINTAADSGKGRNSRIGEDLQGDIVWQSNTISGPQVKVDASHGTFIGPRAGKRSLETKKLHFCRSRTQDGPWSKWHQGFQTAAPSMASSTPMRHHNRQHLVPHLNPQHSKPSSPLAPRR